MPDVFSRRRAFSDDARARVVAAASADQDWVLTVSSHDRLTEALTGLGERDLEAVRSFAQALEESTTVLLIRHQMAEDAACRRQVREQYGNHQLVRAPDGGCRFCPLSANDQIHGGER